MYQVVTGKRRELDKNTSEPVVDLLDIQPLAPTSPSSKVDALESFDIPYVDIKLVEDDLN